MHHGLSMVTRRIACRLWQSRMAFISSLAVASVSVGQKIIFLFESSILTKSKGNYPD